MISITVTSRPRLVVPSLAPEQMRDIAETARAEEAVRIAGAVNVNDEPARPLVPRYASDKRRTGLPAVRDLRFTGDMLAARAIVSAQRNSATVGFVDDRQEAKAARNEQIEPMLGIAPSSEAKVGDRARRQFAASVQRTAGR